MRVIKGLEARVRKGHEARVIKGHEVRGIKGHEVRRISLITRIFKDLVRFLLKIKEEIEN